MFFNKKSRGKVAFIYREGVVGHFDGEDYGKNNFSFQLGAREALWSLKNMNYELYLIIDTDCPDYIKNSAAFKDTEKHINNDLLIHGIRIDETYFFSDFSKEVINEKDIDLSNSIVIADQIEKLGLCRTCKRLNGYLLYQNCCMDKGNIHYKEGGLFELIDAITLESKYKKNNIWRRKKW